MCTHSLLLIFLLFFGNQTNSHADVSPFSCQPNSKVLLIRVSKHHVTDSPRHVFYFHLFITKKANYKRYRMITFSKNISIFNKTNMPCHYIQKLSRRLPGLINQHINEVDISTERPLVSPHYSHLLRYTQRCCYSMVGYLCSICQTEWIKNNLRW